MYYSYRELYIKQKEMRRKIRSSTSKCIRITIMNKNVKMHKKLSFVILRLKESLC